MATLAGQTAFYYLAAASIASAVLAVTRSNPDPQHALGARPVPARRRDIPARRRGVPGGGAGHRVRGRHPGLLPVLSHAARPAERDGGAAIRRPLAAGRGRRGWPSRLLLVRWHEPGLRRPRRPAIAEALRRWQHVAAVGTALFTEFALPFEIVSLVLLAAIVGAVVVARRKTES